jgi:hypothetical protein
MDDMFAGKIGRRTLLTGSAGVAAGLAVTPRAASAADGLDTGRGRERPISAYPLVRAGVWSRGNNLRDRAGRYQARQEHAAAVLNGFVYLIGGFVPIQPPPAPTENLPEPFLFVGTGEILVYTPLGHPASGPAVPGAWVSLPTSSSFPHESMHHINAVAHRGQIWAFGGHAGPFQPTAEVHVFTPRSVTDPTGTWRMAGIALPQPRSAGAAVSVGRRIYLIGGVVPSPNSPDPINRSISTTASVIYLDTTESPLRWRTAPSLREPREHFNAVYAEGRIWVFQGRNERSTHMRGAESMAVPNHRDGWRREQDAPFGASANVLGRIGRRVYSFGGEFIASNITGTVIASQFFDLRTRSWSRLQTTVRTTPLDASGADSKHGTYGAVISENGQEKIISPGGAATAWFDPMSKVHVFTP